MITHDQAQALISARYDQLLTPVETREVQEHLATCAACRQFAAETDLLAHGLRSLPQLPPSPSVSRAVRAGIQGGGSPWGWLGRGMRIATSPALAVASSFVLVAALAFIVVLALRPIGLDEEPRATISALADVIETPTATAEPARTPVAAPTVAPTEAVIVVPTRTPTPVATEPRPNVTPPRETPEPTAPAATQRTITQPSATAAPPVAAVPPPEPTSEVTSEQSVIEEPAAAPTSPPIISGDGAGAPFGSEDPVEVAGTEAPPEYGPPTQPTIEPGGPAAGVQAAASDNGGRDATTTMAGQAADEPVEAAAPAVEAPSSETTASEATESAPAPSAPAPEPTPVDILAVDEPAPPQAAAPAPAPELPRRNGNEAIGMSGTDMAAEIQATVAAGLTDDSGPPTVPASTAPLPPVATVTPAPEAAITASGQPIGAEITGAPAADLEPGAEPDLAVATDPAVEQEPAADPEVIDVSTTDQTEIAPVEAVAEVPVAPQPLGAPEPAWPGIGGGGTQHVSSAGYSAIADGGGVTVFGPDGTPLGAVGGGVPIWSPWGTSLLVIGPGGQGAVWDAAQGGLLPVEVASTAARDVPAGWSGGSPLVQRVYLDGSGLVELRVVPIDGSGGYPLWSGTADSVFGEGVTSARLSPDGGQLSFISGGQFYVAPVSDPGSAAPGG